MSNRTIGLVVVLFGAGEDGGGNFNRIASLLSAQDQIDDAYVEQGNTAIAQRQRKDALAQIGRKQKQRLHFQTASDKRVVESAALDFVLHFAELVAKARRAIQANRRNQTHKLDIVCNIKEQC